MRILGSRSDAEDVLQETFVRVWSRADTYDAVLGSPATWLVRIARNRAIDRLRARRARGDVNVAADDDASRSSEPVTRDTPETVLENRTIAGAVRTALAALTPAQRTLSEPCNVLHRQCTQSRGGVRAPGISVASSSSHFLRRAALRRRLT